MLRYSNDKLINLLKNGNSQEKIYSAWILAMQEENIDIIEKNLLSAPEPGIRRHLATIVASKGKKDILVNFATLDPDLYVKATALKYLYNIEYENIIVLSLNLYYKHSSSRVIRSEVFKILKNKNYKIEYKILKEEIYNLNNKICEYFLKYMFSTYKATCLEDNLLNLIIESDTLYEYRKDIINWLKQNLTDNELIKLLSKYSKKIYLNYLHLLFNDNLELDYELLNSLPLIDEADCILYRIKYRSLNNKFDNEYTKNYIYRLYQYYQNKNIINTQSCISDYLDIIIENILKNNIDYKFSTDEKQIILKILKQEYNDILKYDIELKELYINEINQLIKIFSLK